ncbi:hypothetical protein WI88_32755 [Burkholderia ubonensis]|nr:hypothetical protein WI88_32755 [Burkholderia ubonensis]
MGEIGSRGRGHLVTHFPEKNEAVSPWCTMPALTILERLMPFKSIRWKPIAVAALVAVTPSISFAGKKLADAAECSIKGAVTGRVASALASGSATIPQLREAAAKDGSRAVERIDFAIGQVQVMRQQGETDPLIFASHSAALCMLD